MSLKFYPCEANTRVHFKLRDLIKQICSIREYNFLRTYLCAYHRMELITRKHLNSLLCLEERGTEISQSSCAELKAICIYIAHLVPSPTNSDFHLSKSQEQALLDRQLNRYYVTYEWLVFIILDPSRRSQRSSPLPEPRQSHRKKIINANLHISAFLESN